MKRLLLLPLFLLLGAGCSKINQVAYCTADGFNYQRDETFLASDACNTCTCGENGEITCTTGTCQEAPAASCQTDADCANESLETSFCESGEWTCVSNQCQFLCDIGGRLAP